MALDQLLPGQLRNGGEELTNGMARLREGSHHLLEGSKELEAGSANLALGLSRLHTSFSEEFGDADSGGLAAPVRMNIETSAPVPNNGTGFSPYFAALTLWLGGIMITFVFHCRRLIEPMRESAALGVLVRKSRRSVGPWRTASDDCRGCASYGLWHRVRASVPRVARSHSRFARIRLQ
jgi:putative membrane protein